jgi:O-antigen chain-terminating methyltransferase
MMQQRLADLERELERLRAQIDRLEARPTTPCAPTQPVGMVEPGPRPQYIPATHAPVREDLRVVVGGGGFDFHQWEEHTRGDEQAIRDKQSAYLAHIRGCPGPVLDAGCGRGEFLELLRGEGLAAYGIDLDESMVAHCLSKGLHAERSELLEHLAQLPDGHLGALFAGQVVEHLPTESLAAFVHLAYQKMASGGTIVLETINPECLTVFSGAFYADPTHTKPVHPKAIEFFLNQAGFGPVTILPVSPIPEESRLRILQETAPVDPAIKELMIQANANFSRLNDLLYKPADYAAVARKP